MTTTNPDGTDDDELGAILDQEKAIADHAEVLARRFRDIPEESVLTITEAYLGRLSAQPQAQAVTANVISAIESGTSLLVTGLAPELAPLVPIGVKLEDLALHGLILWLQKKAREDAERQAKALGP